MDFRASFRASGGSDRPQAMFKALRRLHGQNLESKGLNDMTEAFQSFVIRARFFSVGKLRRTWSHSAAEFIKYRRLLPMLLADGQQMEGVETDDFDAAFAFQANSRDERKIIVTNISPRITPSQLQSFFSQFGKISHCSLPREERRQSHNVFATLPKTPKNCGTATITFKRSEDAQKAKEATVDQLRFYDQVMVVSEYVSKRKGGKGMVLSDDSRDDGNLSRTSSTTSLSAGTPSREFCSLSDMPPAVLERILAHLPVMDTVRLERVNKIWMESSMKSWSQINRLALAREGESPRGFGKHRPLRNTHMRAILRRAGPHLKGLDISGVVHLLDDKALGIIASNCPQLKELDISGLSAGWEALSELSDGLSSLEKLSYRDMSNMGDKSFWYLLRGCGQSLISVDLRGASRLRGRCLKLLGPQLEMLYLDGCFTLDSMAFEDLCTNSPGIKELRVNECYQITDENLSMISRLMADLQVFTLCGDRFVNLTRAGMSHISHIKNLVELAFDYNPLVDDAVLHDICSGLPLLKTLSLANAGSDTSITPSVLSAISKFTELEQLDVSSLAAVRAPVIKAITTVCPLLELLQLRNCVYLNDEGVVALKTASKLRHVDLSGSILVSSDAIQEIIQAFPQSPQTPSVTVVVGGTACDASKLRVRGSRVVVDFSDYSSLMSMAPSSGGARFGIGDGSVSDADDDEFESLAAQRSFYIDAKCGEDDSPVESEEQLRAWAETEAKKLGLLK